MIEKRHPLPVQTLGTAREIVSFHYGACANARKVYIQSSLHADELPGMLVSHLLRQRLAELEADGALPGEVVVVPVANPLGLDQHLAGTHVGRFEFDSGENFNRNYPDLRALIGPALPGSLGADPEENTRTLRRLMREALAGLRPQMQTQLQALRTTLLTLACDADLVLDLHCDCEALLHVYAADAQWPDVEPLARYLGAQTTLLASESGGNPFDEACSQTWYTLAQEYAGRIPVAANGCVALTVELRGQGDVAYAQAQADTDAIIAYLARQGHVARPAPPLPELEHPATPLAAVEPIKATCSGVVVYRCQVGDDLEPGDAVADIVDPLRATATPLVSEHGGRLFARQLQRFATAGETIAKVAGRTAYRSGDLLSA